MANRSKLIIPFLLAIGACIFLPGINWGLPSHDVDPFLFGEQPVWTGEKILKLAGPTEDPNRGADVASHEAVDRRRPIVINRTDEDRARIIRRYRLMSYQPDEWNTLKALSEMKPSRGNFDPKLYQYGGLWVYPVGVMLKAASILHLIDMRSDVTFYLDHPEAFGRFYVVARLWSAAWGMIGIVAVHAIVRRIAGGWMFPAVAALCFMTAPIVVNMAHEAKPHLGGAVLMLLAVLAASRYVETGSRRSWIMAGGLCGAALSMVLTSAPIFVVLPLMVLLRHPSEITSRLAATRSGALGVTPAGVPHVTPSAPLRVAANQRRRDAEVISAPFPRRWSWSVLVGAIAVGVGVYAVTNPYLIINLLLHREIIESNLGNSRAMYHPELSLAGLRNAVYLTEEGISPILAIVGVLGAILLARRAIGSRADADPAAIRRRATGLLLAAPALCVAGQCIFVATGKPGEFGRFLLVFDIFLLIEGVVAAATFLARPWARIAAASILLTSTAFPGFLYMQAFQRDAHSPTGRLNSANYIRHFRAWGDRSLAVFADPAPYCCPPVDLFGWKIVLMPPGATPRDGLAVADDSVEAIDVVVPRKKGVLRWIEATFEGTPISWADKPFDVRTRYIGWQGF